MWKVGDKLGRFQLEREIGQGSHGVVFVARDTALDTPVAVKILHPWLTQDTAVRDRFKRELLLARRISHSGVCRLFDLHEEGDAFFITMEYVEGQTLLNILKNEGRLQPLRAIKILRGVCQALAAAHAAGVIHRDLKPANIIVRAGDQPMILDFGTATAGDVSRVTRPGTAVGSMRFIAPEIFTGVAPSSKTDLYSLGVVAYVTLAGKLPYNAASGAIEMLDMIKNQPPQRLDVVQPDVPKGLADAVARTMDKSPDTRFQSALELDAALGAVEIQLEGPSATAISRWAPGMPPAPVSGVGRAIAEPPVTASGAAPATTPEAAAIPTNPPADDDDADSKTLRVDPAAYASALATADGKAPTLVTPQPTFSAVASEPETARVSPVQPPGGPRTEANTVVEKVPHLTLGSLAPEEHSRMAEAAVGAAADAASEGAIEKTIERPAAELAAADDDLPLVTGAAAEAPSAAPAAAAPAQNAEAAVHTLISSLETLGTEGPLTIDASQVQSIHDGTPATTEHTAVAPAPHNPEVTAIASNPLLDAAPPAPARELPRAEPTQVVARSDFDEPDEVSISRITGARTKRRAAAAIAVVGVLGVLGLIALSLKDAGDGEGAADAGVEVAQADAGSAEVAADAGGALVAIATTQDAGTAEVAADAGAEAAIADAGVEPAVVDAGSAPEPDAGSFDFGEEGEGEEIAPVKTPGPDRPPPRRSPVEDAVRAARAKMLAKGFIAGDVPAADTALKKAMAAKGRPTDGLAHAKDAGRAIEAQNVDRAFVMQKLARFNTAYAAAKKKNPRLADKVEPLSRAAAEAFAKGQFPAANKKLNQGFAALGR